MICCPFGLKYALLMPAWSNTYSAFPVARFINLANFSAVVININRPSFEMAASSTRTFSEPVPETELELQRQYEQALFHGWAESTSVMTPEQRQQFFAAIQQEIKSGALFNKPLPESNR